MVAPSPDNIQLRAWIRDFILGSDDLTEEMEAQIASIMGAVLTARGDLLSRGASDVERRALGASGTLPYSNGTDWAWVSLSTTLSLIVTKDGIHGEIRAPEAKPYVLILDSEIARTITALVVKTRVGTVTVTPKIGSTTMGGGASSATTSKSTVTHSSSNSVSVNDTISFDLSSVSSDCEDLSFSLKFTRALLNP